jgi:hypothetical protein
MTWESLVVGEALGVPGRLLLANSALRAYYYELEHRPTGVKVRGEIPDGHYSRGEMSALKQQLLDRLRGELEIKVASALRIAGR